MNTVTQILDADSRSRLARLRGGAWRCLGGVQVSNWMTDVSLFIATNAGVLTITGEPTELNFDGGDDTYARFRIDEGATDLEAASKAGQHLYHFNSGQAVQDVPIVRETVTEHRNGEATWTYVTDLGTSSCSAAASSLSARSATTPTAVGDSGNEPRRPEVG